MQPPSDNRPIETIADSGTRLARFIGGPPPSRRSQTTRHGLFYPTVQSKSAVRSRRSAEIRLASEMIGCRAVIRATPGKPEECPRFTRGVRSARDPAHIAGSVRADRRPGRSTPQAEDQT